MGNRIRLTEQNIRDIILEVLNESYGKWFQTEENNFQEVMRLQNQIRPKLKYLDNLAPEEVWEIVRTLAYINHSAFKVRPDMWDKFPDEMLTRKDNKLTYSHA